MSDRGGGADTAAGLLDARDQRILDGLAAGWHARDPVPGGLVDDVVLAIGFRVLVAEVAAVLADARPASVATTIRSDDDVRTLTFTTPRTTIMVQVTPTGGGRQRLDGWVDTIACSLVRLHVRAETYEAAVSSAGRFEFTDLAAGTMRLVLVDDDGSSTTVTPAFEW